MIRGGWTKGLGVTYATSPMGGDHTAGIVLPNPGNPSYESRIFHRAGGSVAVYANLHGCGR